MAREIELHGVQNYRFPVCRCCRSSRMTFVKFKGESDLHVGCTQCKTPITSEDFVEAENRFWLKPKPAIESCGGE